MQDDCFRRKIMSQNICFRGSGVGIIHCLARFQSDGIRTHHRNLASTALIPERNKSFATINSNDISYFKKLLGGRGVVQDDEKLDDANTNWMRKYKAQLSLRYNHKAPRRCLAVVPQGGNTGLVGGSIPVYDEVIINIGSMNNILSFDKVTLFHCKQHHEGYIMPLDLGAKGSCQIGGNVSTNAGACAFSSMVHFMEVFLVSCLLCSLFPSVSYKQQQ